MNTTPSVRPSPWRYKAVGTMRAIVAADRNWAIGSHGALLVRLPPDLKRFRALTLGGAVVVGRKTLATFPGGLPLAGRRNLVLSRDPTYSVPGGEVYHSLAALRAACPPGAFVIGGGEIYRALLGDCDRVLVTKIDGEFPADAWFPNLDHDPRWAVTERSAPQEYDGLTFCYVTYTRTGAHRADAPHE